MRDSSLLQTNHTLKIALPRRISQSLILKLPIIQIIGDHGSMILLSYGVLNRVLKMTHFFAALHDNRALVNAFWLEIFIFDDETHLIKEYHGTMPVLNASAQEFLSLILSRVIKETSGMLETFDKFKQNKRSKYINFDTMEDLKKFWKLA